MPEGVDLSAFQPDPDPEWYTDQGFVLLRAFDRHGNPDARFADRWEISRGRCPRGAYGWPRPGADNRALGAALAAAALDAELGLWADYEHSDEYGLASVDELAEYLDGIGDRRKGVYSNIPTYPGGVADGLPWWVANYGPNDGQRHELSLPAPRAWQIHQFTSRGGPGGSGLDRNYAPTLDLWEHKPMIDLDNVAYIPATYQGPRPAGQVPNLIVLHSGETGEGDTAAEGMANFFARPAPRANPNDVGSAHVCVDNDSVVRCAPDENRTNGAGGVNNFALHVEQAGRAGQLAEEWADPYSSAVIANTAGVLQYWIAKFPHIRPVFLDAAALDRGERDGVTTHNEVSQVFAGNDGHWDPGPEYPIDALLNLVRGTTPPTPEDDMGAREKLHPIPIQDRDGTGQWLYNPETNTKTAFQSPEQVKAWQDFVTWVTAGTIDVTMRNGEPAWTLLDGAVDLRV